MLSERLDITGEDEECSQDDAENIFLKVREKGYFQEHSLRVFNMFGHSTIIGLVPVLASSKPFSNCHSLSFYSSPLTSHSGDLRYSG